MNWKTTVGRHSGSMERGGVGGSNGVKWLGGGTDPRARVGREEPVSVMEELNRVAGVTPEEDAEWMDGVVVAEALWAKAARGDGAGFESKLLGRRRWITEWGWG